MKNVWKTLGISTLVAGALSTGLTLSAEAVRLSDGRILFDRPPNLVEATARDTYAGLEGSYHFVIEVPSNAGEPLGAVVIRPWDHATQIRFNLDGSEAHLNSAYASGAEVQLSEVGGIPENPDDILVVFREPIQPGETVTVTLNPIRNPQGGAYLFEVTAYPAGETGVGQSLGLGRINIYNVDN